MTGELVIEPPTLINLGFEWLIQGDDNRNAAVQVSYRQPGEAAWSPALPLLRLQRERVFVGPQFDVVVPNMFAGSAPTSRPCSAARVVDPCAICSGSSPNLRL